MQKKTLYLSFDIESDGPVPSLNSMLSFGVYILDIDKNCYLSFEQTLKPLENAQQNKDTMEFWNKNKEAYIYSTTNQQEPQIVFTELSNKIKKLKENYIIVPIAWPACFDWQWFNYYFWKFTGENPLGYSCKCIGSYLWGISQKEYHNVDDTLCKKYEDPKLVSTHKPLDDAKYQGVLFVNALKNNIKGDL